MSEYLLDNSHHLKWNRRQPTKPSAGVVEVFHREVTLKEYSIESKIEHIRLDSTTEKQNKTHLVEDCL